MLAIIKTGGKQYCVQPEKTISVELLDHPVGETIVLDSVLMIQDDKGTTFGKPFIEGATVKAEVVSQGRDKKVRIIKMKRRKHHLKRQGHRQYKTMLLIKEITA